MFATQREKRELLHVHVHITCKKSCQIDGVRSENHIHCTFDVVLVYVVDGCFEWNGFLGEIPTDATFYLLRQIIVSASILILTRASFPVERHLDSYWKPNDFIAFQEFFYLHVNYLTSSSLMLMTEGYYLCI